MSVQVAVLNDGGDYLLFFCDGCRCLHEVPIGEQFFSWTWNESLVSPTLTPSILLNKSDASRRCHSIITNGAIAYCADSWHTLRGTRVWLRGLTKRA